MTADVLRSLAAAMVEAGAEIEISDLPVVLGVRGQLEQLLQNLVANALKFRGDGRARVWVREEAAAPGMAQIAVADGGIGIAPAEREHVFEMFQRLHDREALRGHRHRARDLPQDRGAPRRAGSGSTSARAAAPCSGSRSHPA